MPVWHQSGVFFHIFKIIKSNCGAFFFLTFDSAPVPLCKCLGTFINFFKNYVNRIALCSNFPTTTIHTTKFIWFVQSLFSPDTLCWSRGPVRYLHRLSAQFSVSWVSWTRRFLLFRLKRKNPGGYYIPSLQTFHSNFIPVTVNSTFQHLFGFSKGLILQVLTHRLNGE